MVQAPPKKIVHNSTYRVRINTWGNQDGPPDNRNVFYVLEHGQRSLAEIEFYKARILGQGWRSKAIVFVKWRGE